MKVEQLAKEVIQVLDKQQEYFKTRSNTVLSESKKMERDLRSKANLIIQQHNGDVLL